MDLIIPDTTESTEPTVDERLDIYEGFDPCAAQAIRGELWTLRAQLAEAREAARTCASLLRLLHTSGAINIGMDVTTVRETLATVEKWEGK